MANLRLGFGDQILRACRGGAMYLVAFGRQRYGLYVIAFPETLRADGSSLVKFGTLTFPHVLEVEITNMHEETERVVPNRNVAYRVDKANLGQTAKVTGDIRASTIDSAYSQIEQIRTLNDGIARTFDLEDGITPTFNAKLTDPEYELAVGDWFSTGRCYVPYTVTFLEVA